MEIDPTERQARSSVAESREIDLARLGTVLKEFEQIEYAMAFGSASDGIVNVDSDVDVAVGFAPGQAPGFDVMAEMIGRIEDSFAVACDPTVLNTAGPVLAHEALKGRILFLRPACRENFVEFYVRTCAEFEDLMAWRKRQLAYRGYECPSTAS